MLLLPAGVTNEVSMVPMLHESIAMGHTFSQMWLHRLQTYVSSSMCAFACVDIVHATLGGQSGADVKSQWLFLGLDAVVFVGVVFTSRRCSHVCILTLDFSPDPSEQTSQELGCVRADVAAILKG